MFNIFLEKKLRKKLALYDAKKFSYLHKIVLEDDGIPHLEKKMDDVTLFFECKILFFIKELSRRN